VDDGNRTLAWWLSAAVLVGLVLAIYAQTVDFAFVNYDDDVYVTENDRVQAGLTSEGLRWAFTTTHSANWHPLTWLSHMLDVELFGLDPGAHHRSAFLLHAANAVLLLLVLRAFGLALPPALATAALFAVHPLRVESVAWVSERKDVLSGLFFFLSLACYAAWARRPRVLPYAGLVLCFGLGLLAKPMLVTLPFLLLLLDVWPLGRWRPSGRDGGDRSATPPFPHRRPATLLLEKLPLLALVALSAVMTLRHQRAEGAVVPFDVIDTASRWSNAAQAVWWYLGKSLVPDDLAVFYPHPVFVDPEHRPWGSGAILAAAGLALTSGAALLALRSRRLPVRALAVGWLWCLGMLVPVVGIVQVGEQAWADRYAYLPLVGATLGLSAASWSLIAARAPARLAWAGVAIACVVACGWRAHRQVAVWRDSETLFQHAAEVTEKNYIAYTNLGDLRTKPGRTDLAAAEQYFLRTVAANPRYANGHYNLAAVALAFGRRAEALEHFERCLEVFPAQADVRMQAARLCMELGRVEEALPHFEALDRLLGGAEPEVVLQIALLRERTGAETASTLRAYERAAALQPTRAAAQAGLGRMLLAAGRTEEARRSLARAVELDPGDRGGHAALGALLDESGEDRRAVEHLRIAVRAQPLPLEDANRLARVLACSPDDDVRDGHEALELAQRCVGMTRRREPHYLDTMAAAYAELGLFQDAIDVQREALRLVPADERDAFEARRDAYRAGRAHRE